MPRDSAVPAVGPLELLPSAVDAELWRMSGLLESVTEKLAKALVEEADAETTWKVAEARCILASEGGSEDRRRAQAIDRHQPLYVRAEATKAASEALREKARSIRARLGALQTLAANARSLT